MSLTSTSNRVVATGNGVTTLFNYNRLLYSSSHLQVYLNAVLQTTGYTVSGVPGTSTSVTFTTAPGSGVQVLLLRVVPLTQLSVYAVGGAFPAATTEKNFDLAIMASQQFDEKLGRAVTLPVESTLTAANIPDPANPVNYGLGLKIASNGSGLDTFSLSANPFTSPLTTKGDLAVYSTAADRLAVGTDGQSLLADSTQARGVKWTGDHSDAVLRVVGSADATKKLAFEVDGLTTGTTRTITPPNQDLTLANVWVGQNDFRLSLTTGVPVTTSDVTGAGTLYAVPYVGNRIALYDGTAWVIRNSAQFSLALTLTSGKPYDVFCYDNAGVPTLEVLVWTNDTTRATALTYQNGVRVKSGDATRRYLGSLYASGVNTTEDSVAKRYLWNLHHRVLRVMRAVDTTDSWTYTTLAWRQANANAANQLDFIVGVAEDAVEATLLAISTNSIGSVTRGANISLDTTTTPHAQHVLTANVVGANEDSPGVASYVAVVAEGRHTLVWIENSTATGTTTWYGDVGGGFGMQTGLYGTILA